MAQKQKELGGNNMSTGTKVVIIVFAVVMALSMMLPTLASVVASNNAAEEAAKEEETSESASGTADSTSGETASTSGEVASEEAAVPDNESLKSLATQYEEQLAVYKERLAKDGSNLAALLNLGQNYMNWGYSAYYSSTTDEEKAYSKGLIDKAVSYFDKYLAINDSDAVKVDRAMCSYYAGDTDAAVAAIEQITKDNPSSPLAWANLGVLYENKGDSEKATEAYKKAIEADPNDEYGAKSYANQRLISLNSTVSSPADAGAAGADSLQSSTPTSTGLSQTLSNDAGVGF
ncbi:MAG: tetratricopeptide repeat protein [Coriobacteriales bacterium]|nr:tetratricopeptide repeat protein [Coriobacteriales bacterium]